MAMLILSQRIQTALKQLGTECPLEEVMNLCPDITWNQVFLAIDHLSRTGQVRPYDHQTVECIEDEPIDSQAFEHEHEMSVS